MDQSTASFTDTPVVDLEGVQGVQLNTVEV